MTSFLKGIFLKVPWNFIVYLFLPVLSCVWLFATPETVARQAPLPMEFSRQEHWSELPFPTPSYTHTYTYILGFGFSPHSVTAEPWVEFPVLYSTFSLVISFIHSINTAYVSIPIPQFTPPPPLPPWHLHICFLCLCLYFCFANKIIFTIFLNPHRCVMKPNKAK